MVKLKKQEFKGNLELAGRGVETCIWGDVSGIERDGITMINW